MHLHIHLGIGAVHHMEDHIAVAGLLQGTLKGIDQMMGQLTDKSYRIRQKDLLSICHYKGPCSGIQSRKKLVFRQDPCSCQPV